MTRSNTALYLPDGHPVALPVAPRTWADAGAAQAGDPLNSRYLATDAGAGVAWHRQLALFQGVAGTVQSVPASAWTALTGLAEMIDNYAGHNDTANTGRYYVPQTSTMTPTSAGDWWLCTGYIPFNSSDTTHDFIAGLRVNGGATIYEGTKQPSASGHLVTCMVMDLVQATGYSDNYIELMAWQNTAAAVSTAVSGKTSTLTVRWAAPDHAWSGVATPALPALPHTWTGTDIVTGSATGGANVPLNVQLRDVVNFLNNPPAARFTAEGTTQTIPAGTGTWTSILFPTVSLDNYGAWSSGTTSRFTCRRAGLYLIYGLGAVAEPSAAFNYRASRLLVNGTTAYAGASCFPASATTAGTAVPAVAQIRLAFGDYVELQMQHNYSSAVSVKGNAGDCARMIALWRSL